MSCYIKYCFEFMFNQKNIKIQGIHLNDKVCYNFSCCMIHFKIEETYVFKIKLKCRLILDVDSNNKIT